jgi:hypothetical protein
MDAGSNVSTAEQPMIAISLYFDYAQICVAPRMSAALRYFAGVGWQLHRQGLL